MVILVNGKETGLQEAHTITSLIGDMKLNPDTVVVEHNGNIVKKGMWDEVTLKQGDVIEIVAFVGGGD